MCTVASIFKINKGILKRNSVGNLQNLQNYKITKIIHIHNQIIEFKTTWTKTGQKWTWFQ